MDITTTQLKALAATARKAYDQLRDMGLVDATFDAWRKDILRKATKLTSFRDVTQESYFRAISAFKACLGEGQAGGKESPRVEQKLSQARWHLQKTFDEFHFDREYVLTLSEAKFKTRSLQSLDAKQIWQLVYTLRNRAKSRDKPR